MVRNCQRAITEPPGDHTFSDFLNTATPFEALFASTRQIQDASAQRHEQHLHHIVNVQDLVLRRVLIWKWLAIQANKAWEHSESADHWLGHLVQSINQALTTKRKEAGTVTFHLQDFFPLHDDTYSNSEITLPFSSKRPSESELGLRVTNTALQILHSWLPFDGEMGKAQPRAELAFLLITKFGPGVLLLDTVVASYNDPSSYLFHRQGGRYPSIKRISDWVTDRIPAPAPAIKDFLKQLHEIVDPWRSEDARRICLGVETLCLQTQSRSATTICREPTGPSLLDVNQLRLLLFPLLPLVHHLSLGCEPTTQSSAFTRFWRKYRQVIMTVREEDDTLNPWRECAKSRTIILQPGGPFDSGNLYTRGGFFSALVYRGITHNSLFLHHEQVTLFPDLATWWSTIHTSMSTLDARIQQWGYLSGRASALRAQYYANLTAYGAAPVFQQKVENADVYNRALSDEGRCRWLLQQQKPGFEWAVHFL
jgi:hypothetical protein